MSNLFTITTTTAEVAVANQVKALGNNLYQQMVRSYNSAYNLVWNNPNVTADKVVAALGTDAVKTFTLSAGLAAYLNSAGANVVATMPTTWHYAANADGSVTLTAVTPPAPATPAPATPAPTTPAS